MTDYTRIKAVDEWTLDVLSAPYGGPNDGKDAHGEYFSANTDFYESDGAPLPLVAYYHGHAPDGTPQGAPDIIGRAVKAWRDARGLWHRVVLDKGKALAQRVWDAANAGTARASTGVAGYMARTNARTGEITHWLIGELSIWDAEGDRQPANQYAVASVAAKRLLKEAGFNLDSEDGAQGAEQPSPSEPGQDDKTEPHSEDYTMEPNETQTDPVDVEALVRDRVDAALAAAQQERDAADAAEQDVQQRIKAEVDAAREAWATEAAAHNRLPSNAAPQVAKYKNLWKYDNMEACDLALMAAVLGADNKPVSENALKALAIRTTQDEHQADMWRIRAQMADQGMPVKANELNQSTLASYGDEWVGVAYSTMLWDKIRTLAGVVSRIPAVEIPQGSESVIIPTGSTSPTFYKVAQASAQDTNTLGKVTYTVTSSKMGTTNQTLSVGKLGARAIYTGELQEDSLIDWAAELRRDLTNEGAEVLESLVIDGDSDASASTNINDIAGTPASTDYFLVLDGFRKLALVTNTANSRSAGTLTVEDFLETIKLMGLAGKNAMQKDAVSFIVDSWTHWKALELPEVKTRDVFAQPTIENGNLTGLYGYDIMAAHNMHRPSADATYGRKANTSGKLDQDTAANNTTGSILAVRWDQWKLGWKRRMTIETQRIPQADATDVVLLMRVGLQYRDTDAAAISYGVTV
jgi:hypothetical protein